MNIFISKKYIEIRNSFPFMNNLIKSVLTGKKSNRVFRWRASRQKIVIYFEPKREKNTENKKINK